MSRRSRFMALGCLLAVLLLAGGCFDYEVDLTLAEDGSGVLEVALDLPQHLAQGQEVNLDTIVYPAPQRVVQRQGGRLKVEERLAFEWMDVVAARRVQFFVENTGTGFLGMGGYTYRVTARVESVEGDMPNRRIRPGTELDAPQTQAAPTDPAAAKAARLLGGGLAGHFVTLTLNLPGEVTKAWPVAAGATQVEPRIKGGTVTWQLPLGALAAAGVRHSITFHCDFKGHFAFRGDTQSASQTRLPTEGDVEAGQKAHGAPPAPGQAPPSTSEATQ